MVCYKLKEIEWPFAAYGISFFSKWPIGGEQSGELLQSIRMHYYAYNERIARLYCHGIIPSGSLHWNNHQHTNASLLWRPWRLNRKAAYSGSIYVFKQLVMLLRLFGATFPLTFRYEVSVLILHAMPCHANWLDSLTAAQDMDGPTVLTCSLGVSDSGCCYAKHTCTYARW